MVALKHASVPVIVGGFAHRPDGHLLSLYVFVLSTQYCMPNVSRGPLNVTDER